MHPRRNGCRGPSLLASIEAELLALRQQTPDLAAAFTAAFRHAVGTDTEQFISLREMGGRIVEAVETASLHGELAYHDRHHAAESVLAMGWLCGVARALGAVPPEAAALGVVAMVGHDLLHDGSPPRDGVLEARAAEAVNAMTLDLGAWQRSVIHAVILGTDPSLIAANAARAARLEPQGAFGHSIDLVVSMANEADVFASLLPNLGAYLTGRLVSERQSAGFDASGLAGVAHRRDFLLSYQRLSPAARSFGLDALCKWQITGSRSVVQPDACLATTVEPPSSAFPATYRRVAVNWA